MIGLCGNYAVFVAGTEGHSDLEGPRGQALAELEEVVCATDALLFLHTNSRLLKATAYLTLLEHSIERGEI